MTDFGEFCEILWWVGRSRSVDDGHKGGFCIFILWETDLASLVFRSCFSQSGSGPFDFMMFRKCDIGFQSWDIGCVWGRRAEIVAQI